MDIDEAFERFFSVIHEPEQFIVYSVWNNNQMLAEFETKEEAEAFMYDPEMQDMYPEMELEEEEV